MLVCGESLASEGGLDRVRSQIGVCAQFDVLWAELTGLEHLVVAGHVKGIPPSQVRRQQLACSA
jgi:ABC-type multidrug transport system ATPase subunit